MKAEREIKLKERMKDKEMSVAELSRLSGIKSGTLYRRLRGENDFKAVDILRISKVLGLKENEIMAIFFDEEVSEKKLLSKRGEQKWE